MKHKTAYMGLLLAFALILSYVESLIPFYFGVPGVKLGLANLAVILTLSFYGTKQALLLNLFRIILAGFLFGNLFMIVYSLAGGMLSFLVMLLLRKYGGFGIVGVSVAGGISHNIGQILVAYFVIETVGLYYYLPVLLAAGAVTGFLIGVIAGNIIPHLKKLT